MRKLISYSLYGTDPMYQVGAVKNARLSTEVGSDWIRRFYVSQEIPNEILGQLRDSGAQVVPCVRKGETDGMFWRFLAVDDDDVAAVMVRDVDSRPTAREAAAVREWIDSDKGFHIMRDHPNHRNPIMGGMWGVKPGALPNLPEMRGLIAKWKRSRRLAGKGWCNKRGLDQVFLSQIVYPLVRDDALIHSEFIRFPGERPLPFPGPRRGNEFVGQIYGEDESTSKIHLDAIRDNAGRLQTRELPAYSRLAQLRRTLGKLFRSASH